MPTKHTKHTKHIKGSKKSKYSKQSTKTKSKNKTKTKKSKLTTLSTSTSTSTSSQTPNARVANILAMVNTISNNRQNMTKTQANLPAKLMSLDLEEELPTMKQQVYSKSVSSTFSSSMHNGHVHSLGKQVINDSTKPFIQVQELHNGHLDKYIIPRNISSSMIKKSKRSTKSKNPKKIHAKK